MASGEEDKDTVTERDEAEGWSGDWKWSCSFEKKTKAFVWEYSGFEMDGSGCPTFVNLPKCHLYPTHATLGFKYFKFMQPFKKQAPREVCSSISS